MEREAKRQLERQGKRGDFGEGFEVYLPLELFEDKKGVMCSRAFLPTYIFARVPLQIAKWRSIFGTHGVKGVMGVTTSRSLGVADAVIARLRAQEEGGFIKLGLLEDAPAPSFQPGQKVRLDNGLEGVFVKKLDQRKAIFQLVIFGRDSRHTVDLKRLAASEGA
jgi:transcription antitermination factor NusG